MASGAALLALARTRVGESYRNILVPKNDPNWHGPWDCAEFMSWLVYQASGTQYLYGCTATTGNAALIEAYTGAWQTDSLVRGIRIPASAAAATVGGILLRFPPAPGKMGHIALSDGTGKLIEAHSTKYGVTDRFSAAGRRWDTGVLIPGFTYSQPAAAATLAAPAVYRLGATAMKPAKVKEIQTALSQAGVSPGKIDGIFGPNTVAAVAAFQTIKGLVSDGEVGRDTAAKLGIAWP